MKLSVLIDNNSIINKYFLAEPGLSFYLEDEKIKVLFDCGFSDAFIKNAEKMGIDLASIDALVLSHNHEDHTWGLEHLIKLLRKSKRKSKPILYACPAIFRDTYIKGYGHNGIKVSKEEIEEIFELKLSSEPQKISKNLYFLGKIPRNNNFEGKTPVGIDYIANKPDYMPDDTALVFNKTNSITIITACAHSGICNTIEYAKQLTGISKVDQVIGGLHLLNPKENVLKQTAEYLGEQNIENTYACHCTDLSSKIYLSNKTNIKELGVGVEIEL